MFPVSSFHQQAAAGIAATDQPMSSGSISDSMFLNAANFDEDLKALLYSTERQSPTTAYFPNQPTAAAYQNNNNNNKGGNSPSTSFEISPPRQPDGTFGRHQEIQPGI